MSDKHNSLSFIVELPLVVSPLQTKKLHSTFEVARQFYNQCLAESKKRLSFMLQSKAYQEIHQNTSSNAEQKSKSFQQLRKTYHFQEFDLHTFAKHLRGDYFQTHIDSQMAQKLASRAFKAGEKVFYKKAKIRVFVGNIDR